MFKITLTAEDKFALLMGMGTNDVLLPRQLLTRADFPDLPDTNVDLPSVIPYGDLSKLSSTASPPLLTGTPSNGAFYDVAGPAHWRCGFGPMTSAVTPPTSVTATAASGGTLSANVYNSQYGVVVTAFDTNGLESDPYPYYTDYNDAGRGSFANAVAAGVDIAYATVNGSQKLNVSWSGATGTITKYRVYLGWWYYGFRVTQWLETTATSCTFTANPASNATITPTNITPGAHPQSFSALWMYSISALMVDGETGLSEKEVGVNRCVYNRPFRIEWLPVTGAIGYRIYKEWWNSGGDAVYRFDVGVQTSFDDDLTNAGATVIDGPPQLAGLVPCPFVGMRTDQNGVSRYAFHVAGCAIKSIEQVFFGGTILDAGAFDATWAVPGKGTLYASAFGSNSFVDINGHRYTLLYVSGADGEAASTGEKAISVTLKGVESSARGTGTLLTSLADQYEHWLRNIVLRNRSTTDPWDSTGPMWNDTPNDVDLVDAQSFATVKSVWASRSPGSIPGAWVLGLDANGSLKQESVRTWAARLNQSLDVFAGFTRKSQYAVKIVNEAADLSTTPRYTAELGILSGSFRVTDRPEQMENQITTQYALDALHDTWAQILTEDINAQAAIGEVKPYELKLWCVRRADIAAEIARRRLARRKFPYRMVSWESDMGALTIDLGDTVRITHPDGPGAGGWTDRACFIMKHDFDPQRFVITLEALDLDAVITQVSAQVTMPGAASIGIAGQTPVAVLLHRTLTPAEGGITISGGTPVVV